MRAGRFKTESVKKNKKFRNAQPRYEQSLILWLLATMQKRTAGFLFNVFVNSDLQSVCLHAYRSFIYLFFILLPNVRTHFYQSCANNW